MRHVFRLPACAAPAVLLGLTAGYPTGAKITANLYATGKLTREQAARLLCFCTAPGYAFAAAYTGSLLLRSDRIGLNLFLPAHLRRSFRAYFIALCRKTRKKPKIARSCSRRHRLRCAGRH